ncbi:MAG: CHRD domain-containing protein, partial [Acidobacteriota bacterium]
MRLNAAVLTTLTVMALVATAHGQTFAPGLSGVREVGAPGDPDGAGLAVITLEGGSAHYYLWVAATDQPTAAHVHAGLAGENGSVALDLAPAFQAAGGGTFVAVGSVAIAPALAAAILQNPAGYYANIHTAAFPAGAVRGQLLGDGAPRGAFGASLFGRREAPTAGDPDGQGFATAVISGASLHFYIRVKDIASPTAAHVHRGDGGQSGPVVLDFAPQFAAGVARGEVALAAGLAAELLADPAGFYFNVHNGQFPAGALRGQLGATETVLHFPVAARNPGAGTSAFKSDLRVVAAGDQETPVWAEWYPANSGGSTGPAARARFSVAAGGVAVIDDVVGTLFGANARGAIRLLAAQPISAGINTYNDQRAVGSGTFGQFQAGLGLEHAARAGSLGLGSHRPKADLVDFRTNVGYFNPGPVPAVVRFNVKRPDGAVTNSQAITIPGWANDLRLYHDIISDVPAGERTKADFLVTYNSDRPVFIYSSVVDNRT